jgi:hypothetical protein
LRGISRVLTLRLLEPHAQDRSNFLVEVVVQVGGQETIFCIRPEVACGPVEFGFVLPDKLKFQLSRLHGQRNQQASWQRAHTRLGGE